MTEQKQFKRHIAYKLRVGDISKGKLIFDEEKFKMLELDGKQIIRVNFIANIIDKFVQEGERKFASITLDDASGQIKVKTFGDDIEKFSNFSQGDTIQITGLLRSWNDEIYMTPEIMKKRTPEYLLLRKLELDLQKPKTVDKSELNKLRESILEIVKKEDKEGGAEIDKMIMSLNSSPNSINSEIKKLLEEGIVYEPRPGKIRYLG